ncbi:MAG: PKD domain-containing protein [Methanomicrobiales archaeon]
MLILGSRAICRSLLIVFLLFLLVVPAFANNLYRENASVPVLQGSYIQIDPVGTRQAGEKITITAKTDLPVGSEVLFEVAPVASNLTRKITTGEFSGATGTVTVRFGQDTRHNLLGFAVDLSTFQPGNYRILASSANNAVTGEGQFTVVSVIATRKPPQPVFIWSPHPAVAGRPVSFDGSGSTVQDGNILTWQWDFGDGTPLTNVTGSPADTLPTHTYRSAGVYAVGLMVMDNREQTEWARNDVTVVAPVPPVANFSVSPSGGQAYENHPLAVSLSDMSTGSPQSWAWYVDDTLVSQLQTYSRSIFTKPGNYTIRLVVTNDYGTSAMEKLVTALPFQTITNPTTWTTISQTQTVTDTPSKPAPTITTAPTTPVPQCLSCDSPCVLFTIPCLWIDGLIILVIVILGIWYIRRRWPPRGCRPSDSPKKPGSTGDGGPPTPDITIVTRGGISPRGLDVNSPDIHVDVESGIQYHDKEE